MSQLSILREDGEAVVTLIVPGDNKSPYIARDDHPNFKAIVSAYVAGDLDELPTLFDVAETIAVKFQRLSERVTVENGVVKFDGVAIDGTLSQQILDVIQEGGTNASYDALVNFMEKVYTNPDGVTATRIYDWLKAQEGLTITEAGDIIGYKYVSSDDEYGYRSVASGKEPVRVTFADGDSKVFTGRIPNPLGATVEMPRDLVNNNASQTCSVGLHVGAWGYMGGNRNILEIHVNPRDVVSVPSDYHGQKVRVCRYTVVGPVTEKYNQAVKVEGDVPRERGTASAPTTREDLDLTLAPMREAVTVDTTMNEGDKVRVTSEGAAWMGEYDVHEGELLVVGHDGTDTPPLNDPKTGEYRIYGTIAEGDVVKVIEPTYAVGERLVVTDPQAVWGTNRDPNVSGLKVGTEAVVVSPGLFKVLGDQFVQVRLFGTIFDNDTGAGVFAKGFEPQRQLDTAPPVWQDGDRFVDTEGDYGTITVDSDGVVNGAFDNEHYADDLTTGALTVLGATKVASDNAGSIASQRQHGKGGSTSQAAKGRGLNPAQDPSTGKFVAGRPGSARDSSTGRFA